MKSMWVWLVHLWRIRWLRRAKRRIGRAYDQDIAQAVRDKKSSDDIERIRYDRHWELDNCNDEIAELDTEYLLELAEKYDVPTPPCFTAGNLPSPGWYDSRMFGRYLLTTEGRADVRSAIRAEKRERREGWLPYISAWTGFLGVVVAIIALLTR